VANPVRPIKDKWRIATYQRCLAERCHRDGYSDSIRVEYQALDLGVSVGYRGISPHKTPNEFCDLGSQCDSARA
jgi:hypothetical protein